MEVCCKAYGLANTSWGVACVLECDLLAVGTCIQDNNRVYVIVSDVEDQGRWFANAVPANQRQTRRRPSQRRQDEADRQWHMLQEEHAQVGARLDRLMAMLEHLSKEPDAHRHEQPRPIQRRKGGEHVR